MTRFYLTLLSVALLFALQSCGSRSGDLEPEVGRSIAGYVFETEINGRLGNAPLSGPTSLAIGAMGNLIICDSRNNRLVKVKPNGEFLMEKGGFGFSREQFYYPAAIATSDGVNIYLLDSSNDRIVTLDYDLNWLNSQSLGGLNLEDQPGRATGLAVSSFGDIYIADPHNRRILKFDPNFTLISELTEIGAFLDPMQMSVDGDDNLYIINRDEGIVVVFDAYDNYVRTFGRDLLSNPTGIHATHGNRVFVVDSHDNRVLVLTRKGAELYSFGSAGTGQYRFRQAFGVCVDADGRLYVSDYKGNRVLVYRPVGE